MKLHLNRKTKKQLDRLSAKTRRTKEEILVRLATPLIAQIAKGDTNLLQAVL